LTTSAIPTIEATPDTIVTRLNRIRIVAILRFRPINGALPAGAIEVRFLADLGRSAQNSTSPSKKTLRLLRRAISSDIPRSPDQRARR
jgi:hypothetical protein